MSSAGLSQRLRELERRRRRRERQQQQQMDTASTTGRTAARPAGGVTDTGADALAGKSQRYIDRMKKRREAERKKRGEELLRKFFPETNTVRRASPARKGSAISAGKGSQATAAASEEAVREGSQWRRGKKSGVAEAVNGGSSCDDDDSWMRRKRPQHEPQGPSGDDGGGGCWVQRKRNISRGQDSSSRVARMTPPVASTVRAAPAASNGGKDRHPPSQKRRQEGISAIGERPIARNDDGDDSDDTFAEIDAFCAKAAASSSSAPVSSPAVAAVVPASGSTSTSPERKDGSTAVISTAGRRVVLRDDDDDDDERRPSDRSDPFFRRQQQHQQERANAANHGGEDGRRPTGDLGGGGAAEGAESAGRSRLPAPPPQLGSDDDDDDDILMYAARIKKKRDEDRARERAATKMKDDVGKKREARTDDSDDDDDGAGAKEMRRRKGGEEEKPDDGLAMALFRQAMQPSQEYQREKEEKRNKRRMKKKGDETSSSQALSSRRPTAPRRRRARSRSASSCSEEEGDGRVGGDTALSRYRRSRQHSNEGENGARDGGNVSSPPPSPRRNQKKTTAASDVEEDDLWGDSSVDGDEEVGDGRGERGARRRRKSDENHNGEDRGRNRRRGRRRQRSLSSEENDGVGRGDYAPTMDEEEINRLVPEFADPKLGPPSALIPLVLATSSFGRGDSSASAGDAVPASINRYLQDYQREGIAFLHTAVTAGKGCILGDDMGMGKTVQVIALLTALLNKTGTGRDKLVLAQRKFQIEQECAARQRTADRALLEGNLTSPGAGGGDSTAPSVASVELVPKWSPVLLVAPPSVIKNWINEFATWGHFAVSTFNDGRDRAAAVEKVRMGQIEIFLCGRSLFSQNNTFQMINSLKWKLVIVDEYHEFKNRTRKAWLCLQDVKLNSGCPIIGMTGTAMQNDHEELWNLLHLVQPGLLGEWKEFEADFVKTLKLCRTKDAGSDVLELGAKKQEELSNALKYAYLSRKKKDYLQDALTEKDEKVIFCELTEVQKMLYRHIMSLPDYHLLRTCNTPCDCGINQVFFAGYKKMRTRKEQVEYQRRHKKEIRKRKKCCYRAPWHPETGNEENGIIDPEAVIWRSQHENDIPCKNCPTCILLPALQKLYKVSSHPSLLQVERHPDLLGEGSAARLKAERNLEFAMVALTPDVLERLPGSSYCREEGIMDDHINLSGKMKTLDYCLDIYQRRLDRVLIFSHSTTTLNLIQLYVKSKGYTHLRLDGSTPTKNRQGLIDKFQKDDDIFLFLISTKAGGLGINLTAANKVIVYDVSWNPSYDEQAQDRAFRIGQKRDVEVVRLVSQGTVEELMYARQVYKVHLTRQTLGGSSSEGVHQPARLFRGVAKDDARKGELFGLENLLKFKDGSFMRDVWKSSEKVKARGDSTSPRKSAPQGMLDTSVLARALSGMTAEQVECLGNNDEGVTMLPENCGGCGNAVGVDVDVDDAGARTDAAVGSASVRRVDEDEMIGVGAIHHDDFMREDRGGALLMPGDEGFEEEMGGASQMVHVTCAVACRGIRTPPDSPGRECHDHNAENDISTEAIDKIDSGNNGRKDFLSAIKEDPYISDEIISSSCENTPAGRKISCDISSKEIDKGDDIPPELRVPYVRDSQLQVHKCSTSIEVELGRFLKGMEDKESASEPAIEVESTNAAPDAKLQSKCHSSSTPLPSKTTRSDVKRKATSSTSSGANFMLMAKKSAANATPSYYVPAYGKKKKKKKAKS